jgi:hypothetical protein
LRKEDFVAGMRAAAAWGCCEEPKKSFLAGHLQAATVTVVEASKAGC